MSCHVGGWVPVFGDGVQTAVALQLEDALA